MSTTTKQRVGIWVIAVMMVVGTIGGFLAMVLVPKNEAQDQARQQQLMQDYQTEYAKYQEEKTAKTQKFTDNADEYSAKHYGTFKEYESRVGQFEAASIDKLSTDDLKVGDGPDIGSSDSFAAYYIGWTPDGKVFDGSIDGDKLKAPFVVEPGMVIEGWTKGIDGMKVGGVRELSIPAAQAYGEQGSGESIPPNTPLKFVIYIIEKVDLSAAPQPSEELMRLYGQR